MAKEAEKGVVLVKIPIPGEVIEIARKRGVSPEKIARAAETLLLLEVISMDSELSLGDAVEIGRKVTRAAWERITRQQ